MNDIFPRLLQHAVCAFAFFLAALFCSLIIFGLAPERDFRVIFLAAPFSAAFTALISWAALTVLGARVKIWKGILTGILAGSVSHYLTWYAVIVVAYLQNTVSSVGEQTVDPIDVIWASLVFSVFSLGFFGWATIPLGAIVGGFFAAFTKNFLRPAETPAKF